MKRHILILIDCRGSVVVMTVVMMFIFVGLLAFVIDLAHVKTVKTELSNAADACALRGARGFFPDNITGTSELSPNPGARY
jgi:Flp pilus assembly protein TadG